jgi:hypothetical protein
MIAAASKSANEIGDFVDNPAGADERNWRALDPRRDDAKMDLDAEDE